MFIYYFGDCCCLLANNQSHYKHSDDNDYVTQNTSTSNEGFTKEGLRWAFSIPDKGDKAYWHPLTWLSHTLDCELYGLNGGKHHLTNLLFGYSKCLISVHSASKNE